MQTLNINIDIPYGIAFDLAVIKQKVTAYAQNLVLASHADKESAASKFEVAKNVKSRDWRNMTISPEVKALTFSDRVDLGTTDYKELLAEALEEKYLR